MWQTTFQSIIFLSFFFISKKSFAGTGTAKDVNLMIVAIVVILLIILSIDLLIGFILNIITKCKYQDGNRLDDFAENNFNSD